MTQPTLADLVRPFFLELALAVQEQDLREAEAEAQARPQNKVERDITTEFSKFTRHMTEQGNMTLYVNSDYMSPDVDLVLVPMKNSVFVRGRGKLKTTFDTAFKGPHRYAQAMAYVEGLGRMYEVQQDLSAIGRSEGTMLLVFSVRVD